MKVLKSIGAILLLIIALIVLALIGVLGWLLSSIAGFIATGAFIVIFVLYVFKGDDTNKKNVP